MSVTQQQVLDALAKVASPRGVALTNAGVLSPIAVNDGKVFFSINVDAAEARAWESVRAAAEAAVRAIPGVSVAMVALTAERKPGAAPRSPPPHRHAQGVPNVAAHRPPQGAAFADVEAGGNSRRLPPSLRSLPARAGSENRPPRSIWRSACAILVCGSACSMPTSTDRRCRD